MKVNVHLMNMLQAAFQHSGSVWGTRFGFDLVGGRDLSLDVCGLVVILVWHYHLYFSGYVIFPIYMHFLYWQ